VAGSQAGKKSESQAYGASKTGAGSPKTSEASQKLAVQEWLERSQQSRLQRVHDELDAAGQERYCRGVNEGCRQAHITHHVAEMAYHVEKLALGYNAGMTCHDERQIALSYSSDDGCEAQVNECVITLAVLLKAVWCKAWSKVACHGEVAMFQANTSAIRMKASTAATALISATTPAMAQASTATTLIPTTKEL